MSGWAKKAVDKMTDAEVRHWLRQLGVPEFMGQPDTRSPIDRMIDESTGADRPASPSKKKPKKKRA